MNKKLLAVILSVFLLSGCMGSRGVPYSEGVWEYKDWENMEFVVEEDCVSNKETAITIAESIIKEFQKENRFIGFSPISVFFDTEDNLWIVSFAETTDYPGACVTFAIRKENAEVVKIWLGE